MVYQFHNIEILQLLLMSMLIEFIAELVAAAAVLVVFATSVENVAIDMVEDDRFIGCIPVVKRYLAVTVGVVKLEALHRSGATEGACYW
jgi:NAD/NADP transhydrogenase beta subunit